MDIKLIIIIIEGALLLGAGFLILVFYQAINLILEHPSVVNDFLNQQEEIFCPILLVDWIWNCSTFAQVVDLSALEEKGIASLTQMTMSERPPDIPANQSPLVMKNKKLIQGDDGMWLFL